MEEILTKAIRISTGLPNAKPRPGQLALARDASEALDTAGHALGEGPTGVGKSFALLAAAFDAAAEYGERTFISTESIALQAQFGGKDAPVVAQATKEVTGEDISFAVLKGFSNYLCMARVQDAGEKLTGAEAGAWRGGPDREALADASTAGMIRTEAGVVPREVLVPLVEWALNQTVSDAGDKHASPITNTNDAWGAVSIGSSSCIGEVCPFASRCFPQMARVRANKADIVIGNHSMLAVQAATGFQTVIGSKSVGDFANLLVDEAHRLPPAVRAAGSTTISRMSIERMCGRIEGIIPRSKGGANLIDTGQSLAKEVSDELKHQAKGLKDGEVHRVHKDRNALSEVGPDLLSWATTAIQSLRPETSSRSHAKSQSARSLIEDLSGLQGALRDFAKAIPGVARWIELQERGPVLVSTPVDVGWMLKNNLWNVTPAGQEEGEKPEPEPDEDESEKQPLGVVCVSATLPRGMAREAGLDTKPIHYESPFDQAHDNSLLWTPVVRGKERDLLYPNGRSLSIAAHQEWVRDQSADLVEANGGSALVLSANGSAGRVYAANLRAKAKGRWKVYSQWDGLSIRDVVELWRSDTSSVLVGTRSLMTGVDGPGETCTLVIIDRVPRAASNPVDDARTESIMERLDTDKWSADTYTYVSDAAALLEQVYGRLIRSTNDYGLVASLDPRLHPRGPYPYKKATLNLYTQAGRRFSNVTGSKADALAFLRSKTA